MNVCRPRRIQHFYRVPLTMLTMAGLFNSTLLSFSVTRLQLNSWIAKYSSVAQAYTCGIMQYTKRTVMQSKYNE